MAKKKRKKGESGDPRKRASAVSARSDSGPLADEAEAHEDEAPEAAVDSGGGVLSGMLGLVNMSKHKSGAGFFSTPRPLWEWALWLGGVFAVYWLISKFLLVDQ